MSSSSGSMPAFVGQPAPVCTGVVAKVIWPRGDDDAPNKIIELDVEDEDQWEQLEACLEALPDPPDSRNHDRRLRTRSVIVMGNCMERAVEGAELRVFGTWALHAKYGLQIKALTVADPAGDG